MVIPSLVVEETPDFLRKVDRLAVAFSDNNSPDISLLPADIDIASERYDALSKLQKSGANEEICVDLRPEDVKEQIASAYVAMIS